VEGGAQHARRSPDLGIGSRRFKEFSQDYGEITMTIAGKVAHNTYMEWLRIPESSGSCPSCSCCTGYFDPRVACGWRMPGDGLVEIQLATFISCAPSCSARCSTRKPMTGLLCARSARDSHFDLAAGATAREAAARNRLRCRPRPGARGRGAPHGLQAALGLPPPCTSP